MNIKIEHLNISKTPLEKLSQVVFEQTYLQPFNGSEKENLYALPVERVSHGAQHVTRVALFVKMWANVYRSMGNKEALALTDEHIKILQLVAIFHDAARKNDGKDLWEKESAALCKAFLEKIGVNKETADRYANLITQKEKGGLLGKILQSADCLDVARCKNCFMIERLSVYQDANEKWRNKIVSEIVPQAVKLIAQQHDIKDDLVVKLNHQECFTQKATRDASKPELKQQYEQASCVYLKIEEELKEFKTLYQYYQAADEYKESKQEVEENFLPVEKNIDINSSNKPIFESNTFLECFKKSLDFNEQEIDWLDLQKKFEKDFPKAWEKRGFVLRIFSPDHIDQVRDSWLISKVYLNYCYQDEKTAELHLKFLKLILADDPEFIKHAKVVKNSSSVTPYRIHISNEHSAKLDTLRKTDTLIKTVRWDPYCFVKNFIKSVTKSETNQHKEKLRVGPHQKFTVYHSGVYSRATKPSPYPPNRLHEKKWLSSPQSTSLITTTIQTSAFGHGKNRSKKLIGFSFDPEEALFNRLFIYDGGTISRPYEKATLEGAHNYYNQKVKSANPILFDDMVEFKVQAAKNLTKYTECLARLKWNINTSSVLIFSDTFEARCIAQTYAGLMQERLRIQYLEMGKTLPSNYQVPIHYYLPGSIKNLTAYTLHQQQEDIKFANQIMQDPKKIIKYLTQNDYEFLLIQTNPDAVLKLEHNKLPLILHLVTEGLIHIAEILFNKTTLVKTQVFSDYVISQAKKFPAAFTKIKKIDNEGNTPLHIAVLRGYYDLIPLWHSHLEVKNSNGETPLYSAIKFNLVEGVDRLLKQGAKLDEKGSMGNTALYLAYLNGNAEIIKKILLEKGTKLDEKDEDGWTAFHFACSKGHTDIVELLLKKCAGLDGKGKDDYTALHTACIMDRIEVVELLLENGASIDKKGYFGSTALHLACKKGHTEIVKLLLKKGAKVDEKDMVGFTALHFACDKGHRGIVELLLKEGAKVDEKDKFGQTAFYSACRNGHTEIVELLLKEGAMVDEINIFGWKAFYSACQNGHTETVELLLKKGVKVNEGDYDRILYAACQAGHIGLVKWLLDAGAKVDEKAWALNLACNEGHIEIVKLLLEKGAKLDGKAERGWTALHTACNKGHTEIVKLLLEKNAKQDERNYAGWTALDLACNEGHTEIVELLLRKTTFTKKHQRCIDESVKKKNWAIVRLFLEMILETNEFKFFIEYISYLPDGERKNLPKLLLGKYQEYIFTCNENQFNSGNNFANFFFNKISNNEEVKAINRFNLALMDSTTTLDPDTISTLKNGFLGKIIASFPKQELPTPKLHGWW